MRAVIFLCVLRLLCDDAFASKKCCLRKRDGTNEKEQRISSRFCRSLNYLQLLNAPQFLFFFFHFIKDKNANAHTDHSRSCTVRCCVLLFYFASMKPIIIVPKTHNNYKGMFSNELKYKHRENELQWTNKKRSNKIIARWHTTENKKQHTQWDFELFFRIQKFAHIFLMAKLLSIQFPVQYCSIEMLKAK